MFGAETSSSSRTGSITATGTRSRAVSSPARHSTPQRSVSCGRKRGSRPTSCTRSATSRIPASRGRAIPAYAGEGPHALWHVSEDDSIRRFEPRGGKVWAIGTRLLPVYWFPRECPRATFWAESTTSEEDVERFLGGERAQCVHVVELGFW